MKLIRIGTRTSNLAMWQANKVKEKLENSGFNTEIVGISSSGDKSLGGDLSSSVGQFIHAVDNELISNNIDLAVHSSKDVPVEISPLLSNLAYLERGCTSDLLIFPKNKAFMNLETLLSSNKVKILIHHPDYVALEEWNRKWKGEHEGVQSWMNKLIPSIEFEMEELEWKQLNPKLGKAA